LEFSVHRITSALFAAVIIAFTGVTPAFAQSDQEVYNRIEQLHGNARQLDQPLLSLVEAMRSDDAQTIAGLIEYPLTVKANGEEYEIQSEQDFVDSFDKLISAQTRRAVGRQQYSDLFVNSDGVMLADGAVWMAAVCEDDDCDNSHWAITAINN
jgi:hypothetical protein